jgi:hypothetical protein
LFVFWKRLFPVALAALAASPAAAAREPGDALTPGFNLFSKQQDVEIGQANARRVRMQFQVVKSPFLQGYVTRVGSRLAAAPEARQSGFHFTFTLLHVGEINAFALPGGPMFIYTGLVKAVDNEAQLAAVMSHEMSHVILRHPTHEATKANIVELPVLLAGKVLGTDNIFGRFVTMGLGLGANSFILKFSRDAESEADALGSHLMAEAGYDPVQMARFFDKLAAKGARPPQILSDHPNPVDREKAIVAEVKTLPAHTYGYQTGQFLRVKAAIDSLGAPPPKPAQPEAWQQYRGQSFSVSHPGNWQAFGESGASSVTIAPQDGLVKENGKTQIGRGAILSYFVPASGRSALKAATGDLIRQLHKDNPKLEVTSKTARSVRVGGSNGLITMMASDSPFGGAETDALVTVTRPRKLFYIVLVAPSRSYVQMEDTFQQLLDSVKFN